MCPLHSLVLPNQLQLISGIGSKGLLRWHDLTFRQRQWSPACKHVPLYTGCLARHERGKTALTLIERATHDWPVFTPTGLSHEIHLTFIGLHNGHWAVNRSLLICTVHTGHGKHRRLHACSLLETSSIITLWSNSLVNYRLFSVFQLPLYIMK